MYFPTYFTLCDDNEAARCATHDLLKRGGNARYANTLHGGDANVISLEIFARASGARRGKGDESARLGFGGVWDIYAG